MTTDELNAIVQAVMQEMEKAGVDFDFKAETPQPTDLVYVMRGTADSYKGITVKWQNLLDIIVQKATDAKDEAVSAKDIAIRTLATIRGIESNVNSMKSSVETTANDVATMKASVETSEANVTQMKTSVEATKSDVEGMKSDVTTLKAQTQTIVDNAKDEVTGLLDTKVNYSDLLTYEQIMATTDLTNKVPSAQAFKDGNKLRMRYIEATFSNGYAVYDMTNILASEHMSKINMCIAQLESGMVGSDIIRSVTITNDTTIKMATISSSYSGLRGIFIIFS